MILVDAGPLIALIDRKDVHHKVCRDALPDLSGPLVTTWPTLTEAVYLLGERIGWSAQESLWRVVLRGDLEIHPIEGPLLKRTHDLMKKYRDLPMDWADATLVALAESKHIHRVFTLDADFRVYRLQGRKPFELVP
jgi:predicted nucleic acid-binding protein